jgi:hypothetical protein
MRAPISAADLLRAFKAIEPQSEEERRAIATLLGLEWQVPSAKKDDGAANWRDTPRVGPEPRERKDNKAATVRDLPGSRHEKARRRIGGGLRVLPPRQVQRPRIDWRKSGPALQQGAVGRAPEPAPLFRPQWTRAILAASLSIRRPIGPPDLAGAVERIARGEALPVLPRQPVLSLARGVQALIDIGENMQPFWHDRAVLRRDLRRIVGAGSLEMLECAGSPAKTRRGDRARGWADYLTRFPPQLDACVLLVSDFGIGGGFGLARGASPATWSRLARRLAQGGHRVVGFVPFPPARWPQELAAVIDLVPWDRTTTVGRISLSRGSRARR